MLLERSIFFDHEKDIENLNPQTNLTTDYIERNGSDSVSSGSGSKVHLPLGWQSYQRQGSAEEKLHCFTKKESRLQDKLFSFRKCNSVKLTVNLEDDFFGDGAESLDDPLGHESLTPMDSSALGLSTRRSENGLPLPPESRLHRASLFSDVGSLENRPPVCFYDPWESE